MADPNAVIMPVTGVDVSPEGLTQVTTDWETSVRRMVPLTTATSTLSASHLGLPNVIPAGGAGSNLLGSIY